MRQDDVIRVLREHGPMTAAEIAEHDRSHIDGYSKIVSVRNRLRILERQGMVRRLGMVDGRNGCERILWGLEPWTS